MQDPLDNQLACIAECITAERIGRFGKIEQFFHERSSETVTSMADLHAEYCVWCGAQCGAALDRKSFEGEVAKFAKIFEAQRQAG